MFKSLGKIYERKYQKDVQESMGALEPLMKIVDSVFVELNQKQNTMKKSIQNSFMMAYAESTYLDYLKTESNSLEKSLESLSHIDCYKMASLPRLLLNTTKEIQDKQMFPNSEQSYSDILYSLTAAKKKIERELDWTLCSFDKEMFPLIRNTNVKENSIVNSNRFSLSVFNPSVIELSEQMDKKIRAFTHNQKWVHSQNLSLILKHNDKKNEAFFLETKAVPDANDLTKVLEIPKMFNSQKITAKKLAKKMNVKPRMALYYLEAAEMLGLLEKISYYYKPTALVDKLEKYSKSDKDDIIQHLVEQLPVVKAFFTYLKSNSKTKFSTQDIAKFLEYSTNLSPSTAKRRASTISSWLKTQKIVRHRNDVCYLNDDDAQTKLVEFMKRK